MKRYIISVCLAAVTLLASEAAETRIILKPGPEGLDKWFGSFYNQQGVDNTYLRVGGWGDYYDTLIKFEGAAQSVPGTFKRGELWFYRFNTTRPTDMEAWLLTTRWGEMPWDHANLMGYYLGVYPGPTIGAGWYGLDVTSSVNYWRINPQLNYGWFFGPTDNDNQFDEFYSSDSTSGSLRPELHLVYDVPSVPSVPDFKMPLPSGKEWKLTVEVGGKANDGTIDSFHSGKTYYSLDFGQSSRPIGGGTTVTETDIPVLAMAGGKVYGLGANPNIDPYTLNGYHVRIDHDGDGNPSTGFQTVYCHLKSPPLVQMNQDVSTGKKLGIMGMSGTANTGIHLHVTFYYKGTASGNGTDTQLNQIRLDRLFLKDYKLMPNVFTPIFYSSSNVIQ